MKILFAIQATGNGHISRAKEIYPELLKYGTVHTLLSGVQADVDPGFPVTYQMYGLSFIFGKKGGVDIWQTLKRLKLIRFISDIIRFDIHQYDLVISDYEPISVWTGIFKNKKVYGLSHQSAVIHPDAAGPLFENDRLGKWVLHNYAICRKNIGFYTHSLDSNIFPAVIRSEIRKTPTNNGEKIVVYLPSYADKVLIALFTQIPNSSWLVFSKHTQTNYQQGNVSILKIENEAFIQAMAHSKAVLMGAGFEGPCEALYMKKKLMVIPMKGQYEQQCNAAAFKALGVPAIPILNESMIPTIINWLEKPQHIDIHFPEDTAAKAVKKLMLEAGLEMNGMPQINH